MDFDRCGKRENYHLRVWCWSIRQILLCQDGSTVDSNLPARCSNKAITNARTFTNEACTSYKSTHHAYSSWTSNTFKSYRATDKTTAT